MTRKGDYMDEHNIFGYGKEKYRTKGEKGSEGKEIRSKLRTRNKIKHYIQTYIMKDNSVI